MKFWPGSASGAGKSRLFDSNEHQHQNNLFLLPVRSSNVKIVSAITTLSNAVEYFRCHMWTMDNSNVKRMLSLLSRDDAKRLDFDGEQIDWRDYHKSYAKGIAMELMRKNDRRKSSMAANRA